MPREPGKSGNPNGYKGPRDRARREVFEKIKGLGHLDAIEILSTIANDQNAELGYRVAASSPGGPCSDEPLLLEAGGFRLELPLSVIRNCADLALSQASFGFFSSSLFSAPRSSRQR